MALTPRDKRIYNWLLNHEVADTMQLKRLFFDDVHYSRCTKTLKRLHDYGYIKRERDDVLSKYIYYVNKKPEHLIHDLIASELYVQFKEHGCKIIKFMHRPKMFGIMPDVLVLYKLPHETDKDPSHRLFVEVQRSGTVDMCTDKYKKVYNGGEWKEFFKEFPTVLVVSDLKGLTKYKEFKTIKIGTDYKKFKEIVLGSV